MGNALSDKPEHTGSGLPFDETLDKKQPVSLKPGPLIYEGEGRCIPVLSRVLCLVYHIPVGWLRYIIRALAARSEGGEMLSLTLRRIFRDHHGVDIGMYSYGCFCPLHFRPKTRIGRFCSIYHTVRAFNGNHPMNLKSTHPYFYNPCYGYCKDCFIEHNDLEIGNDVFIGHNAIILPTVTSIGDGAIIGAGTVVSRNVPPFGVVIGNPGRLIRFRFSRENIDLIRLSRWWDRPLGELLEDLDDFHQTLNGCEDIR